MQVTLAQAIAGINIIKKQINRLQHQLNQVAFQTVAKEEQVDDSEVSFYDVYVDLGKAEQDYIDLLIIIRTVNNQETLPWDGREISLSKAIELAKLLRRQSSTLISLGRSKKKEVVRSYSSTDTMYKIAMFDPKAIAAEAEALDRKADRLSALIESKNHSVNIPIPFLEKYL